MLQCTSKADMEDWVRDINRLRGGRVDLASGQNLTEFPTGQDIYEGGCGQFANDSEHVFIFVAMATVVPDDEVFRVSLRQTDALRFSGSCYLEILRFCLPPQYVLASVTCTVMCDVCSVLYGV